MTNSEWVQQNGEWGKTLIKSSIKKLLVREKNRNTVKKGKKHIYWYRVIYIYVWDEQNTEICEETKNNLITRNSNSEIKLWQTIRFKKCVIHKSW